MANDRRIAFMNMANQLNAAVRQMYFMEENQKSINARSDESDLFQIKRLLAQAGHPRAQDVASVEEGMGMLSEVSATANKRAETERVGGLSPEAVRNEYALNPGNQQISTLAGLQGAPMEGKIHPFSGASMSGADQGRAIEMMEASRGSQPPTQAEIQTLKIPESKGPTRMLDIGGTPFAMGRDPGAVARNAGQVTRQDVRSAVTESNARRGLDENLLPENEQQRLLEERAYAGQQGTERATEPRRATDAATKVAERTRTEMKEIGDNFVSDYNLALREVLGSDVAESLIGQSTGDPVEDYANLSRRMILSAFDEGGGRGEGGPLSNETLKRVQGRAAQQMFIRFRSLEKTRPELAAQYYERFILGTPFEEPFRAMQSMNASVR